MVDAFENLQNSSTNFDVELYGREVGEKIYTEIMNLL